MLSILTKIYLFGKELNFCIVGKTFFFMLNSGLPCVVFMNCSWILHENNMKCSWVNFMNKKWTKNEINAWKKKKKMK